MYQVDAFTKVKESVLGTLIVSLGLYAAFLLLEPAAAIGQAGSQFEISLTVTDEITFITAPNNVTLSPSLSGITGGTADGGTQTVVRTNNTTGYTMTLRASSSVGMIGDTTGSSVPAYVPSVTAVPDFTFTAPANTARFGFTVEASTSNDLDPSFLDDGGDVCDNGGSDQTTDSCWINATTGAQTIINRGSATDEYGATTTIKFRAVIQSNPSPSIPEDTYTATTTITVTNNA